MNRVMPIALIVMWFAWILMDYPKYLMPLMGGLIGCVGARAFLLEREWAQLHKEVRARLKRHKELAHTVELTGREVVEVTLI